MREEKSRKTNTNRSVAILKFRETLNKNARAGLPILTFAKLLYR